MKHQILVKVENKMHLWVFLCLNAASPNACTLSPKYRHPVSTVDGCTTSWWPRCRSHKPRATLMEINKDHNHSGDISDVGRFPKERKKDVRQFGLPKHPKVARSLRVSTEHPQMCLLPRANARIPPIFVDMKNPISSHLKPSGGRGMLSRHSWIGLG